MPMFHHQLMINVQVPLHCDNYTQLFDIFLALINAHVPPPFDD